MKKVVFLLILLSLEVNSFAEDQKYVPPIGIPAPSFGINETYRMYDYEPNQNPALTYYDSPSGGKYTHYVDSSSPNATTNGVPSGYGSPENPRKYIPQNLPAGSVVEVHNSYVSNGTDCSIYGNGTSQYPIFVRGVNDPQTTLVTNLGYGQQAEYIIVEGFTFPKCRIIGVNSFNNNHLVVRDCNIAGTAIGGSQGGILIASWSTGKLENIVVYNNEIHDTGDEWNPLTVEGDPDIHGISVATAVSYLWLLDNTIYHCEGDGIQINSGDIEDNNSVHHIYVGGNTSHHNLQSGMWTKNASDVIFSQNIMYGFRNQYHKPGNGGAATGMQYGPERVWFLFNRIYDTETGIAFGSNSGGAGQYAYLIGNLIYNIGFDPTYHANGWSDYQYTSSWGQAGMMLNGGVNRYLISNTFYNCRAGINAPGSGSYYLYNNIFNTLNNTLGENHVWIEDETGTTTWNISNNLFYQTGGTVSIKHYHTSYTTAKLPLENGNDNITGDPLFVDPSEQNFNLQETSPVKDLQTSEKVQAVYARFLQLYGIDLAADIDGVPRTAPTIVLPEPEDTSGSDIDADVNTDTGSNDTGTVITETPSVPAVDTGSSNTTGTTSSVSTPKINPLPMPLADTSTAETNSSNNVSTAEYSTINPLYNASNSGLHVDESKAAKVRTIKVHRIFERYDDIYCPPNKNSKSSASYE